MLLSEHLFYCTVAVVGCCWLLCRLAGEELLLLLLLCAEEDLTWLLLFVLLYRLGEEDLSWLSTHTKHNKEDLLLMFEGKRACYSC